MSVDTKIMVSQKYNLREICEVMENHLHVTELKIDSNVEISPGYFNVHFNFEGDSRMMHVHLDAECPVGPCIQMSLHSDEQSIRIMHRIADIVGGFVCDQDTGSEWEMHHGQLWEENGLPYFLKWATINNKMPNGTIRELNNAIKEWQKKIKTTDNYETF